MRGASLLVLPSGGQATQLYEMAVSSYVGPSSSLYGGITGRDFLFFFFASTILFFVEFHFNAV